MHHPCQSTYCPFPDTGLTWPPTTRHTSNTAMTGWRVPSLATTEAERYTATRSPRQHTSSNVKLSSCRCSCTHGAAAGCSFVEWARRRSICFLCSRHVWQHAGRADPQLQAACSSQLPTPTKQLKHSRCFGLDGTHPAAAPHGQEARQVVQHAVGPQGEGRGQPHDGA